MNQQTLNQQLQYGQQSGMQQQYAQQPGMAQQYGQQPGMQQQYGQPKLQVFARGNGIDQNEYNGIIQGCTMAYNAKTTPLSNACVQNIKQILRGEWFVFVCTLGNKDNDFSLSIVTGSDFLSFSLDNKHFQVCRLAN